MAEGAASEQRLAGGCHCRAVRYVCGPLLCPPTFCHCESCRRVAGAHVVAWLTVARTNLDFGASRPAEYSSSPGVYRHFCNRCGTPLTYRNDSRPTEIDIAIGTLDRPQDVQPMDHLWMEDALPWDRPGDGLPQYARSRPAP